MVKCLSSSSYKLYLNLLDSVLTNSIDSTLYHIPNRLTSLTLCGKKCCALPLAKKSEAKTEGYAVMQNHISALGI